MKWLLVIIPAVIVLLLLIPVEFRILYILDNGKSSIKISTAYLFGLIKPELQPFDNKNDNKKRDESKEKYKERNNKLKKERKQKGLKKLTKYRELIDYITKKVKIREFKWETKLGLSEPHYLSILYGFMWSIKSLFVGYLLSKKEVGNIKINILPIYNSNTFRTQFNCIINIRMVYIINIWIWLIKLYKGGDKNDRPSNRSLNENYNE